MAEYTLDELLKEMGPQAQRDKALINQCTLGLGLYAAQLAQHSGNTLRIDELRSLTDRLVGYWGLSGGEGAPKAADFLDSFDDRVFNAKHGTAIGEGTYRNQADTIYGLHRYGEELVAAQGNDAMTEILDMGDLMRELAQYWDFEPFVAVESMVDQLRAEVHTMLNGISLPGQAMAGMNNAGYDITQAILFDSGRGFVLGHHPKAPAPFVTWEFADRDGEWNHNHGHYYASEDRARIDYLDRVSDYTRLYKAQEVPIPTAAAEMEAEQNYNAIDGIHNNQGFPKPDLTDGQTHEELRELAPEMLPEEKASVLEQIRAAQQAPSAPRDSEREKKQRGPEL